MRLLPLRPAACWYGILAIASVGAAGLLPAAEPAARPGDGVALFNGKNLDGWEVVAGDAADWKVVDGILICSGRRQGWLGTKNRYASFRLRGEQLDHGVVEMHPLPLAGIAKLEDLEVGHAAGPSQEVGARLEPLDLLPERQVRLLENLVGIGPIDDERADEGVEPPLGGGEQGHELVVGQRHGSAFGFSERTRQGKPAGGGFLTRTGGPAGATGPPTGLPRAPGRALRQQPGGFRPQDQVERPAGSWAAISLGTQTRGNACSLAGRSLRPSRASCGGP